MSIGTIRTSPKAVSLLVGAGAHPGDVVGNICRASPFGGYVPPLIATVPASPSIMEAPSGPFCSRTSSTVPARTGFFSPGDIVTGISLAAPRPTSGRLHQARPPQRRWNSRPSALPSVSNTRRALLGHPHRARRVAPTVIRARRTEDLLRDGRSTRRCWPRLRKAQCRGHSHRQCAGKPAYRRDMVGVLTRRGDRLRPWEVHNEPARFDDGQRAGL